MIVVAIIGILAAIAIPDFLKFQAKAKQSEAKTNLGAVFTTQVAYFGETNEYSSFFDLCHWEPEGQSMYTYSLPDQTINNTKGGGGCQSATAGIGADATAFTAGAMGNIDNDTDCDSWEINDAKELTNTISDL